MWFLLLRSLTRLVALSIGVMTSSPPCTTSVGHVIFGALCLGAFTTAFYMFRQVFLVFYGDYRGHGAHGHDAHAADAHHGHGADDGAGEVERDADARGIAV